MTIQVPPRSWTRPWAQVKEPAPSPLGVNKPQIAYFYVAPTDGTTATDLAAKCSLIVMTYHQEPWPQDILDAGYTGLMLQYVDGPYTMGPDAMYDSGESCPGDSAWGSRWSWDTTFCANVHPNDAWFLDNGAGTRLYRTQTASLWDYMMDHGVAAYGSWVDGQIDWAEANLDAYNGWFFDDLHNTLANAKNNQTNSDGSVTQYATDASYRTAWQGFLDGRAAGTTRPIWINTMPWSANPNDIYGSVDGYMVEVWTDSSWAAADIESMMDFIDAHPDEGWLLVTQGTELDEDEMRFGLACYLMVARDNIHYRYANGANYDELWWYDDYDLNLGAAQGARTESPANVWTREFANYTVTANLNTRTGTIT